MDGIMAFIRRSGMTEQQELKLVDYLKCHGGSCDCEVLHKVAPHVDPENWGWVPDVWD
jgi:hypothetical protein